MEKKEKYLTGFFSYLNLYILVSMFQFYVSPKLALIGLGIVPPVAIMSRIYGRYVRGITKAVQDSLAEATTVSKCILILSQILR